MTHPYPVPDFFNPTRADKAWHIDYETRAHQAAAWAAERSIQPASQDKRRIWLLLVDMQNTFCLPDFELFVAGSQRTRRGGRQHPSMPLHLSEPGRDHPHHCHAGHPHRHADLSRDLPGGRGRQPPAPYSLVTMEDVPRRQVEVQPCPGAHFDISPEYGQEMLLHYVTRAGRTGQIRADHLAVSCHARAASVMRWCLHWKKPSFSIPWHAAPGRSSRSKALRLHRALFGHRAGGAERSQGETLGSHNPAFIDKLQKVDALVIAGQAKSHCVAWTISGPARGYPGKRIRRWPESVPAGGLHVAGGGAGSRLQPRRTKAFVRFAEAGMHRVKSTDPMESWEGFPTP